ncbi:phosphatidate cytidylyltransferase [Niastella vici]|uniref:Phosphatidate cytidylyltransferase n=1 Tax=Niastella vici TaxID=1703345 RepID=A0A1V9FZR1_9BACT|nr:phosphatidate cytidylyltransferase [Niastella vici]OQP63833.1 phosphatidate cytidylyltransferase [Niastella vici]
MNNLAQRAITGLILTAIIIAAISLSVYSFILLMLVINVLTLLEFYRLFQTVGLLPRKTAGILLSICIVISYTLVISGLLEGKAILINIPFAFSIFVFELYSKATNPFVNLAFTFLGVFSITIPYCFFISIAFWPVSSGIYDYKMVLGYFFILWASDTCAYFVGKYIGSHHLFERISPKKTWEGSLGGMVGAVIVAYVVSYFFKDIYMIHWIAIALIIVVFGSYGDLIKSLMKRSLNLKDSGTILPGHGGMLDRFDSLLGSAPFVFSYLMLCSHE